jgi:tetratricopeptide (TPR) repeat protein
MTGGALPRQVVCVRLQLFHESRSLASDFMAQLPPHNPATRNSSRFWSGSQASLLVGLPMIFYGLFAGWIVFATYDVAHAKRSSPVGETKTVPAVNPDSDLQTKLNQQASKLEVAEAKLALQQEYLDKRSTEIDKRAEDLEHLISEMTIGTTVYSFILGLFAYFSLKAVKSDAEADLAKINGLLKQFRENEFEDFTKDVQKDILREIAQARAEFEGFKAEVRNDVPAMYGIERSLGVILERIRRQVDMSMNWTLSASYEAMTEEERQAVLMAEMTVAGFEYFGLPSSNRFRSAASQIYLGLANFYAARSRIIDSSGQFSQVDMRRAFIYIDRACATDPHNPRAFSQRAALRLIDVPRKGDRVSTEHLDHAQSDLETSLALSPVDARALYNLAWITKRRGDLRKAIELLTKIIDNRQTIAPEDRGHRVIDAFTNRACYRATALLPLPADTANQPRYQTEAARILADCRGACEEAKSYNLVEYCRAGFVREFSTAGDLDPIRQLLSAADVANVIDCV